MNTKLIFQYIILVVFLTGCAVAHRVSYEDGEGKIPQEVFSGIENGKTEKSWVVNQLGSPFNKAYGVDNSELYTYRLTRADTRHASLLLFLRYNGVERDVEYFHVVFENDVVKEHWHDRLSVVQGYPLPASPMTGGGVDPHPAFPMTGGGDDSLPNSSLAGEEHSSLP